MCENNSQEDDPGAGKEINMTLYEIDEQIMNCVDEETGEIIDPDKLAALQMEFSDKVEGIALWIKNLLSDADQIRAEEKKLSDRRKVCENKAQNLKDYLSGYLAGEKFKTPKVAISYRKSESVNVSNVWEIPEDLRKYKDPEPDKTAIKAALKAGREVKGAELVTKQNMLIK